MQKLANNFKQKNNKKVSINAGFLAKMSYNSIIVDKGSEYHE